MYRVITGFCSLWLITVYWSLLPSNIYRENTDSFTQSETYLATNQLACMIKSFVVTPWNTSNPSRYYLGVLLKEHSVKGICDKVLRNPLRPGWMSLRWYSRHFRPVPKVHLKPAAFPCSKPCLPAPKRSVRFTNCYRFTVQMKPSICGCERLQPTGSRYGRVGNGVAFQSQSCFTKWRLRGWKT